MSSDVARIRQPMRMSIWAATRLVRNTPGAELTAVKILATGATKLARMFHEGTRMIAKGFAPGSRREEEEWLFHGDDEQRRDRRKERARAA